MKIISQLLIILFSSLLFGQDAEKTDLEIGDVAPTWALMYAPGKFEFLRNRSILLLTSFKPDNSTAPTGSSDANMMFLPDEILA